MILISEAFPPPIHASITHKILPREKKIGFVPHCRILSLRVTHIVLDKLPIIKAFDEYRVIPVIYVSITFDPMLSV